MKTATPELAEQRVILSNVSWQTFEQLLKVTQSPTFPWLSLDVIPKFIGQSLVDGETATLRAFRVWVREQQNGQSS